MTPLLPLAAPPRPVGDNPIVTGAPEHPLATGACDGSAVAHPGSVELRGLSAWFGERQVLVDIDLSIPANSVTALIGPSGSGKSTLLRCINRMHEVVPGARHEGGVLIGGDDVHSPGTDAVDVRRRVGMVFQRPNPFPTMSIRDNVAAGLKLNGVRLTRGQLDGLAEESLTAAGLWSEVRDRLGAPAGGLSGGQQQRLCIARAIALHPDVLLMDEPASALDPQSTARIEELMSVLAKRQTIVIVTHNMQQAARVASHTAFLTVVDEGQPARLVEFGPTTQIFGDALDPRTRDYVSGRFG